MQQFLLDKSIFHRASTLYLLIAFFAFRGFSFLLVGHGIIQAILVFIILMVLGVVYYKKPNYAWYIVLGELLLGGSGHYLEFGDLSIRSLIIFVFFTLWFLHQIGKKNFFKSLHIDAQVLYILVPLFFFVLAAAINGLLNDHNTTAIIQDLLPFSYLLLLFPSHALFKSKELQQYIIQLLIVFLVGQSIFALFTLVLFSTGIVELQEPFYKWFRDVNAGKITSMGTGFWRIVDPSHILGVPLVLVIASLLMKDEKHHKMWRALLMLGLLLLVLNLSRGYILGLGVGLIVLFWRHSIKRWIIVSATVLLLFVGIFSLVHLSASRGSSLGWELFGVRIASVAQPNIELSAATRMQLLPGILNIIASQPLFGVGLGATVTYTNLQFELVTTRQFDWGYLEMYAELGFFGFVTMMALIIFILLRLAYKVTAIADYEDFYVGLIASLFALLVMNLTAPIFLHVIGLLYLTFLLTFAVQPHSIFTELVARLYQIFNKRA